LGTSIADTFDKEDPPMPWLMILVLLLALLLFGIGFTLKVLWIIAAIVLIVWLLGFVARGTGPSGRRGRWYRW
jgi:hypothetical protein